MNKIIDKLKRIKLNRLKNIKLNLVVDINNGYIIFEDNWISIFDEFLFDTSNKKYPIIAFKEINAKVIVGNQTMGKQSCVKIDRNVIIGELFSTYL